MRSRSVKERIRYNARRRLQRHFSVSLAGLSYVKETDLSTGSHLVRSSFLPFVSRGSNSPWRRTPDYPSVPAKSRDDIVADIKSIVGVLHAAGEYWNNLTADEAVGLRSDLLDRISRIPAEYKFGTEAHFACWFEITDAWNGYASHFGPIHYGMNNE